jgi:hypothetical protein
MNTPRVLGLILVVVGTTWVLAEESEDSKLAKQATTLERLVRITEKPHLMDDWTATLCSSPDALKHDVHLPYRGKVYCNIYTNELAKATMLSGKGVYPEGSLIVKTKLPAKEKQIELYTVMRKMKPGYDEKNGDWEYSLIDGRSLRVVSRGRTDSCIECHKQYNKTDHVTRVYLIPGYEKYDSAK